MAAAIDTPGRERRPSRVTIRCASAALLLAGYGGWTHGEAVAAGMMCALRYGASAGLNDSALVARVEALLSTLGLPTRPPTMTLDAWLGPMTRDKKRAGDEVKLILCRRPGACEVVRTGYDALSNWLRDSRCAIL